MSSLNPNTNQNNKNPKIDLTGAKFYPQQNKPKSRKINADKATQPLDFKNATFSVKPNKKTINPHDHSQCSHDHHTHHHADQKIEKSGPIGTGLTHLFTKAKSITTPAAVALKNSAIGKILSKTKQPLSETHTAQLINTIPARTRIIGASFAASASTYMTAPDHIGFNIAAIAAGFYLMHHASEYALSDINELGKKAGWSAMGLGMISGLVHSANEAAVSISSVAHGNTDLALSAVVSHQAFHTLGILGAVAAISGIEKDKNSKNFLGIKFNAMNFLTVGTAAMAGQLWAGELWGGMGAAALASGGLFLYQRVKDGTSCSHDHSDGSSCCGHDHSHDNQHNHIHNHGGLAWAHDHGHALTDKNSANGHDNDNSIMRTIETKLPKLHASGKAALSLGALMGVSHFTVQNAVLMTNNIDLSPAQLGVVIAAGAALSEGYLSIRAALKKQSSFAFGNIMGCNITNTMLIGGGIGAASLGVNALDSLGVQDISNWITANAEHLKHITIPESLDPRTASGAFHTGVFVGAPLLAAGMMAVNKGKISRAQGEILAGAFAAYLAASSMIGGAPCHQHKYGDIVINHCSEGEKTFLDKLQQAGIKIDKAPEYSTCKPAENNSSVTDLPSLELD